MNELLRRLLYLPPQASTFARPIDWLHFVVIGVTMAGATGVALLTLFYFFRFYRRREGEATVHLGVRKRQEVFTIGSVLLLFLVWWVVGFYQYIDLYEPPKSAMDVYVTAKQWMWKFAYPGGRRAIGVLTVPVGRPVRMVMTSRDVIHSFYVPAFRIKFDVIPGRYSETWFEATEPGAYEILCTEYCGVGHSRMRGTVVVLSQQDYDAWLGRGEGDGKLALDDFEGAGGVGEQSASDLPELGRLVASRKQCLACHTLDGQRHIGPSWRGLYRATIPLADGRTVVADEAYLTRSMMDPAAEVPAGYPAVMPTYQGILEAPEAAAIVEFIKSLREGADLPAPVVTLPQLVDGGFVVGAPAMPGTLEPPGLDAGSLVDGALDGGAMVIDDAARGEAGVGAARPDAGGLP
ncbi:MAG: cytochrome c oxidase subunit II [Polyangiales bacterium]